MGDQGVERRCSKSWLTFLSPAWDLPSQGWVCYQLQITLTESSVGNGKKKQPRVLTENSGGPLPFICLPSPQQELGDNYFTLGLIQFNLSCSQRWEPFLPMGRRTLEVFQGLSKVSRSSHGVGLTKICMCPEPVSLITAPWCPLSPPKSQDIMNFLISFTSFRGIYFPRTCLHIQRGSAQHRQICQLWVLVSQVKKSGFLFGKCLEWNTGPWYTLDNNLSLSHIPSARRQNSWQHARVFLIIAYIPSSWCPLPSMNEAESSCPWLWVNPHLDHWSFWWKYDWFLGLQRSEFLR